MGVHSWFHAFLPPPNHPLSLLPHPLLAYPAGGYDPLMVPFQLPQIQIVGYGLQGQASARLLLSQGHPVSGVSHAALPSTHPARAYGVASLNRDTPMEGSALLTCAKEGTRRDLPGILLQREKPEGPGWKRKKAWAVM